jgi:hypothetical protein
MTAIPLKGESKRIAPILNTTPASVYALLHRDIARGVLPAMREGCHLFVNPVDVDEWAQARLARAAKRAIKRSAPKTTAKRSPTTSPASGVTRLKRVRLYDDESEDA